MFGLLWRQIWFRSQHSGGESQLSESAISMTARWNGLWPTRCFLSRFKIELTISTRVRVPSTQLVRGIQSVHWRPIVPKLSMIHTQYKLRVMPWKELRAWTRRCRKESCAIIPEPLAITSTLRYSSGFSIGPCGPEKIATWPGAIDLMVRWSRRAVKALRGTTSSSISFLSSENTRAKGCDWNMENMLTPGIQILTYCPGSKLSGRESLILRIRIPSFLVTLTRGNLSRRRAFLWTMMQNWIVVDRQQIPTTMYRTSPKIMATPRQRYLCSTFNFLT